MKKLLPVLLLFTSLNLLASEVVNDVTRLHPIVVDRVIAPRTVADIVKAVKSTSGPISIGGAKHSQGGQIAEENSLHLDMRSFNKVVAFDPVKKTITVQSGITWRDIQDVIDPANLSASIMQSYSNFTVGGSLSVNCHGRYVGTGPIILSVKSIKIVLADGRVVEASPTHHRDLFYSAIGGYGGIGIIVEATLQLTDNTKMKLESKVMPIGQYQSYFASRISDCSNPSTRPIFHNADIYPPDYKTLRANTWRNTDQPVTITPRLVPRHANYWLDRQVFKIITGLPFEWGKAFRRHVIDPLRLGGDQVEWRNYEASQDTDSLEPADRKKSTYVLQEYFIPVDRFDEFYPRMAAILRSHHVNAVNVSIRHANQDPGSLLAWARTEVFAFVLYYKQGTSEADKKAVGVWTRELIDAALSVNGSYYLPYQNFATPSQFHRAYPGYREFFAIKQRVDPTDKFRNKLWDAYYPPAEKN